MKPCTQTTRVNKSKPRTRTVLQIRMKCSSRCSSHVSLVLTIDLISLLKTCAIECSP